MNELPDEPRRAHVMPLPSIEIDRRTLAAIVDAGQASETEIEYYEGFSDPAARALDKSRRRANGQYLRRLRRRDANRAHGEAP